MKLVRNLFILLFIAGLAVPAQAKEKKEKPGRESPREALIAAPLFVDVPAEVERGQKLLNEACTAALDADAICDLVVKDTEIEGFFFKPDSGVMLTSIEMLDSLKDEELRAAFAWAALYAAGGLREKAVKLRDERAELVEGLAKINPSVGVGSVRVSGNTAVGAGVALGPGAVVAIVGGLSEAVEDARLRKDLAELDAEVMKKLYAAGFERKGMVKLLKRALRQGNHYLADRETGIGHVDQARVRKAEGPG